MRNRLVRTLALWRRPSAAILLSLGIPCSVSAQQAAVAAAVQAGPKLDGLLDDECWGRATPVTDFTQVKPVEGATPSERTEVRFVFTPDQLFIGLRCYDSEPAKIITRQMRRDAESKSDDLVRIAFDTFGRGRDGYLFEVNPVGARRDGLFGKFARQTDDFDNSWDTLWSAQATTDAQG